MRCLVLIALCAAVAGCKKDRKKSEPATESTGPAEGHEADDDTPPAWAARDGQPHSGFFCYQFTYDGKPNWHCKPTLPECEESQVKVREVGTDLGACTLSAEAHCFTIPDADPVCAPTAELCDKSRSHRARMATQYVTEYSPCHQVTNQNSAVPGVGEPIGDAGAAAVAPAAADAAP